MAMHLVAKAATCAVEMLLITCNSFEASIVTVQSTLGSSVVVQAVETKSSLGKIGLTGLVE